jgi:tryptophan synthase beta chain
MQPDKNGYFGEYGGRFVPETLIPVLDELEDTYEKLQNDVDFLAELEHLSKVYSGRPTPLYYAESLTKHCGGAKILLKRETMLHTGAHKVNNALGQGLLLKRWANSVLSPKREPVSTGLPLRQSAHVGNQVRYLHGGRGLSNGRH